MGSQHPRMDSKLECKLSLLITLLPEVGRGTL